MNTVLFRCEQDGKLLRKRDALDGKCLGHTVRPATGGSLFEWIKVQWWKMRGDI